uniref:Uncharacterized protein n=1 Tax=Anguilla anguilla TaxID=7936 RepID=A0A0E9S791_ANGAN
MHNSLSAQHWFSLQIPYSHLVWTTASLPSS